MTKVYRNSTELMQLHGVPIYMADLVDACLYGKLNLFLIGDAGSGKTQLARDVMSDFDTTVGDGSLVKRIGEKYADELDVKSRVALNASNRFSCDKTLFILGRNDMDTRELFQRINLGRLYQKPTYNLEPLINSDTGDVDWYYPQLDEKGVFTYRKITKEQADTVRKRLEALAGTTEDIKELTSKINTNLIVVDELPNCVPAVRAQLFNLFDGFIEIGGRAYGIGGGYCVGIATGNIGQKFTESSNDLGRALKDRMHVTVDVDYFFPQPADTFEILASNTNPRVNFETSSDCRQGPVIDKSKELVGREIPLEKLIIANYLLHGLDYCSKGSKRKMKDAWPTQLENHEQGSDIGLVLPVSPRGAKSILRLSQALDYVAEQKGASLDLISKGCFESMMEAYKFAAAYSGVLNEADVQNKYDGDRYKAINAIIATTKTQYDEQAENIAAGIEMVAKNRRDERVLNLFRDRWVFMKDTLDCLLKNDGGS